MEDIDRPEFARALYILAETFNEPVSDLRAEGYFDALRDFSLEQASGVIRTALRTSKFFPRPVELRELFEGDAETNADAAWAELIREIKRVGYIYAPEFKNSIIPAVVKDVWGSWSHLCQTLPGEGPELVGWMKQFKSAYRSHGVRAKVDALNAGIPDPIRNVIRDIAAMKQMPSARAQENLDEE